MAKRNADAAVRLKGWNARRSRRGPDSTTTSQKGVARVAGHQTMLINDIGLMDEPVNI